MGSFSGTSSGSNDDTSQTIAGGSWSPGATTLSVVKASFGATIAGLRFDVGIPAGATITSAVLTIRGIVAGNDDVDADIYCERADDAADFASTGPASRTLTTASVSWSGNNLTDPSDSPDFASVVQEVIDNQAGWDATSHLVVLVKGLESNPTKNLTFESWDTSTTGNRPILTIQYTAGVTVSPAAASCVGASMAPTALLGSLSLTPSPAAGIASTPAPTAVAGSVAIIPTAAAAVAGISAPTPILGSISIAPGPAAAIGATVAPTVPANVAVTPSPASSVGAAAAPTSVAGSLPLTPSVASAVGAAASPTSIMGNLTVIPSAAATIASTSGPTVLGVPSVFPSRLWVARARRRLWRADQRRRLWIPQQCRRLWRVDERRRSWSASARRRFWRRRR